MENCKIFYEFRDGRCLVVPEDGYFVNGKVIDICMREEIRIDFNPYHDKKGRFTTKAGAGGYVRPSQMYLWEFPKRDGETSKEWLDRFEKHKAEVDAYMDKHFKAAEDRINAFIPDATRSLNLRDHLEPEMVRDIADSIDAFAEKFPMAKGSVRYIVCEEMYDDDCVASFNIGDKFGNGIVLNAKRFKDKAKLAQNHEKDVQQNFHPKGTDAMQYVQHEIAHAFDQAVFEKGWKKLGLDAPPSRGLMQEVVGDGDYNKVIDGVSIYAAYNHSEFVAEALSEYVNSANPRPVAKMVGQRFESYAKIMGEE